MSSWGPPHYADKHSPGPWKWVPFKNWDGGLQAADGSYVISNDETDNTPDNPHDAALIASAPTMLSLLRELEPHMPAIGRTFRYVESGKEAEIMDIQRRLAALLEGLK